jgi:Flavin reductase like domain
MTWFWRLVCSPSTYCAPNPTMVGGRRSTSCMPWACAAVMRGDKMANLLVRAGVTGSPILLDSLSYVEARVFGTIDCGAMTTFVADVLDGSTLDDGEPLTLELLRRKAPGDLLASWRENREQQRVSAWRLLHGTSGCMAAALPAYAAQT